jgi:hypothetical protein
MLKPAILLFTLLLLSVFSVTYVKKASAAGECPSGQVKDWAGICFKESEAKACPTCAPGSAAAAEKSGTPPEKSAAEKPVKSTGKPHCTLGTKATRFPNGKWICLNPHGRL